jgi:hypothetical protein
MRRLLIAVFTSSLALALIAPAAHGATEVQQLTLDGTVAGGPPGPEQGGVELKIDYLVQQRNGHKRLVPQRVTSFAFLTVPVSCDQVAGPLGSFEPGPGFGGVPAIKITEKRFSYRYTATWGDALQATVQFAGQKMWQERTKWRSPGKKPKPPGKKFFWKRASGTLNIIDYDYLTPGGPTNCTTNGPRPWSAHQCKARTGTDPVYLPQCFEGF